MRVAIGGPGGDVVEAVYLDEQLVRFCVAADDEAGTVEAYVLDGDHIALGPGGRPMLETRLGVVRIERPGERLAPVGAAPPHLCHARACIAEVPPAMFMCKRHWQMVPRSMQSRIWATYRRGQEIDKSPSSAYLAAAQHAVEAVARAEAGSLL